MLVVYHVTTRDKSNAVEMNNGEKLVIHYVFNRVFLFLSHNNPCFPCNIAITNFVVLYTRVR